MGHVHSGVGRHHLWVLIVDGGMVVGAGVVVVVVVVVVVPCCYGVWVFVVLKVAIDVAHTQTVHTTSVILWWHRWLGTTPIMVVIVVDVVVVVVSCCMVVVVVVVVGHKKCDVGNRNQQTCAHVSHMQAHVHMSWD